jgi:hypothetical protein
MAQWDPEKDVKLQDFGTFRLADGDQKELRATLRQYDGGTVKLCIDRHWTSAKKGDQRRRVASFALHEAKALGKLLKKLKADGVFDEDESA